MKKFLIKIFKWVKNKKRKGKCQQQLQMVVREENKELSINHTDNAQNKWREICQQPAQMVVIEDDQEQPMDHIDSSQAPFQPSTDSISICTSDFDEYQDGTNWLELTSRQLGSALSVSSICEDTVEPFTDGIPNGHGLQRSFSFDSLPDDILVQNLGNQKSGLCASLHRNFCLSLNTSDLFASNSASIIEPLNLAEHLRPCCFHNRSSDTAVDRSQFSNPEAQKNVNLNKDLESLMEKAIQENVEETSFCGEPVLVLPGDPKVMLNLKSTSDSISPESQNHGQLDTCLVSENNAGEHNRKQQWEDKNNTLYKPTFTTPRKRRKLNSNEKGHCQMRTDLFRPKKFKHKKILENETKRYNRRKARALCHKSWDGSESPRREAHLFGMKGSRPSRKIHAFHTNGLEKQQTLDNRHARLNKLGCKCCRKDTKNKKRKKKLNILVMNVLKKNYLESWQTEETNYMFARKRKSQSVSCVKNHLKRKADIFNQIEFKRRKIFKNEGRKRRKRHCKGWDWKESHLKNGCSFHLKDLEQSLKRKTYVFHIKSRECRESWNNIQALCSLLSYKSSWKNSENKKRKKYLNEKEKNAQENHEENWQRETNYMTTRKAKVQEWLTTVQKPTGQAIRQPLPVYVRRPGGRPTTQKYVPQKGRQKADDQSPQCSFQQLTQREVQRLSDFRDQNTDQAQLLPEQSKQNSQKTEHATQQFSAHGGVTLSEQENAELLAHVPNQSKDGIGLKQTEQADERVWTFEFSKQLPYARGSSNFSGRKIKLRHSCQIDCILAVIMTLVRLYPEMKSSLRNSNEHFQLLYFMWGMGEQGKFDDAKKRFWLKHGIALPKDGFLDFKVKLEADWILEPLKINIFEKSKCTNKSCTFDEEVSRKFKDCIREFSRRCLMNNKQYTCFQDLIDAWSDEDMPCSECNTGTIRVTRRLDCGQGSPPLLPFQMFFEVLESTGHLGEFVLPVPLNGCYTSLEQPEEIVIGNQRYRLHALSYAITQYTMWDKGFFHERCQIWNDKFGKWIYYDGEGWGEPHGYTLKPTADETLGKSYRVAYFTKMEN